MKSPDMRCAVLKSSRLAVFEKTAERVWHNEEP
jgi:hypothetical protein